MTEAAERPTLPPRVPTGIVGLDTILRGGVLQGGVYAVVGPPGAGKTILGNQICFHHVATGGRAVSIRRAGVLSPGWTDYTVWHPMRTSMIREDDAIWKDCSAMRITSSVTKPPIGFRSSPPPSRPTCPVRKGQDIARRLIR